MRILYSSFTTGLIEEDLSLRTDLEDYQTSLSVANNVTPLITGGLIKRSGTKTLETNTNYQKLFNFNKTLIKLTDTQVFIGSQSFYHDFTDINKVRVATTKDRAFMLQPSLPLQELKYYKNTNDYDFFPVVFKHPALTDNIDSVSPGTSLTLDRLVGDDVVATAQAYAPFNLDITYFQEDKFVIVKSASDVTTFRVTASSVIGMPPVNNNYEEVNGILYERTNQVTYPTYDSQVNYGLNDLVYYFGSYYRSNVTSNNHLPTTTHWTHLTITQEEQSVFSLTDVGKYLRVNQGIILITAILDQNGNPATGTSINNKVRGNYLIPAVTNSAIKDSWFICTSVLDNITAITIVQQRLVLSTDDAIYFSAISNYTNFLQSSVTLTADPFSVNINSNLTTIIKYMTPWRNGIIVHTDRSEIYVYSDTIISALSIKAEESIYFAISDVEPVQIQGDVLYIAKGRLRSIIYSREQGGLVSTSLTNQILFKDSIKKIVSLNNLIYLLTSSYIFCVLYDKEGGVVAVTKHVYPHVIMDIAAIDDKLYLITEDKLLIQEDNIYTDETVYTLEAREDGMVSYNNTNYTIEQEDSNKYGFLYDVDVSTVNLDVGRYMNKPTNIDSIQMIKDVVVHVVNTSDLIINDVNMEIMNNSTTTIRKYEEKKVSDWTSGNDQEKGYRVQLKSSSPFNFYLKGISINVK